MTKLYDIINNKLISTDAEEFGDYYLIYYSTGIYKNNKYRIRKEDVFLSPEKAIKHKMNVCFDKIKELNEEKEQIRKYILKLNKILAENERIIDVRV